MSAQFPRYKKKGFGESFRFCDPKQDSSEDNKIKLSKLGWMKLRKSREMEGTPKNITVSKRGKHGLVSIQCELEFAEPVHASDESVGIDLGIAKFATLSSGEAILL